MKHTHANTAMVGRVQPIQTASTYIPIGEVHRLHSRDKLEDTYGRIQPTKKA
ncbi:hypothetical protein [Hydrogenophaga sp.]|uniref:hypothetical protein n=1 Tax=Hydrogenophaga sp. TaxID=1904254 RepID=UPI002626D291|nr:hypothetical protein [Hydrogenophaga sp.]MDM7948204.1 hypothetical protein [Hydrogenophaga sp.]